MRGNFFLAGHFFHTLIIPQTQRGAPAMGILDAWPGLLVHFFLVDFDEFKCFREGGEQTHVKKSVGHRRFLISLLDPRYEQSSRGFYFPIE